MEMSLNDRMRSMPPGFRFNPSDETLLTYYLKLKMEGRDSDVDDVIREINFCKHDPWDLPSLSILRSDDQEWFFFSPLDYKYAKSNRSNRKTKNGYWKPTGKDCKIKGRNGRVLGMKKHLVFYRGKFPNGTGTNWILHEYHLSEIASHQKALVLCRVKKNPVEQTRKKGGTSNNVVSASGNYEAEFTTSEALDQQEVPETPTGQVDHPQNNDMPSYFLQNESRLNKNEEEEATKFADSILLDFPGYVIPQGCYEVDARSPPAPREPLNQEFDASHKGYDTCYLLEEAPSFRHYQMRTRFQSFSLQFQADLLSGDEGSEAIELSSDDESIAESYVPESDQDGTLQYLKSSACQSAGRHQNVSFIVYDTPSWQHESNPPLLYLVNCVVGVLIFIIILREMVIFAQ